MSNNINFEQECAFFYKIIDYPFVETALQKIVFNKLYIDGYVYCKSGLYPSNKEFLIKSLKRMNSVLLNIIDRNSSSFSELYEKYQKIGNVLYPSKELTLEENQSIVYSITHAKPYKDEVFWFSLAVHHFLSKDVPLQRDDFMGNNLVELVEIDSLSKYIHEIEGMPTMATYLFRGHSNVNYEIRPSLFRKPEFYKNEYRMYQELVLRCPSEFLNCKTHLDFLVEMQHYGLPTRLLDFSFNPLVALFFACEVPENTGEIIVYSMNYENILYGKDEEVSLRSCLSMLSFQKQRQLFEATCTDNLNIAKFNEFWDELIIEHPNINPYIKGNRFQRPVFVKPARNNKRIAHQEGAFLLWGLSSVPYDKEFETFFSADPSSYRFMDSNQKQVIYFIRSSNKGKILKSLDKIGINRAYIYPEIDDVAKYIKNSM